MQNSNKTPQNSTKRHKTLQFKLHKPFSFRCQHIDCRDSYTIRTMGRWFADFKPCEGCKVQGAHLEGGELEERLRQEAAVGGEPPVRLESEGVIAPQRLHAPHGVRYIAHDGSLLHHRAVGQDVVVCGLLGILPTHLNHHQRLVGNQAIREQSAKQLKPQTWHPLLKRGFLEMALTTGTAGKSRKVSDNAACRKCRFAKLSYVNSLENATIDSSVGGSVQTIL